MSKIDYIITGASGLIGNAIVEKLVESHDSKSFFLIERNLENLILQNISKKVIVINCAFDFLNLKSNIQFVKKVFLILNKKNIRIIKWIQLSSATAYQGVKFFNNNFKNYLNSNYTLGDKYSNYKFLIDKKLLAYYSKNLINQIYFIIPSIVTGKWWDKVIEEKSTNYIPNTKKRFQISSEELATSIHNLSKLKTKKGIYFYYPKHNIVNWNSNNISKIHFKSYHIALNVYKKFPKLFTDFRSLQLLFSVFYKLTGIYIFYLFKHIHSIEVINKSRFNDKVFKYV